MLRCCGQFNGFLIEQNIHPFRSAGTRMSDEEYNGGAPPGGGGEKAKMKAGHVINAHCFASNDDNMSVRT